MSDNINVNEAVRRPTATAILAGWKAKITEHRFSEESTLRHRMPDQSKWHEGQADALERCCDQLEHQILKDAAALAAKWAATELELRTEGLSLNNLRAVMLQQCRRELMAAFGIEEATMTRPAPRPGPGAADEAEL